jgi:ubiquinol-cytochrome c reductase cytochrome c subunit
MNASRRALGGVAVVAIAAWLLIDWSGVPSSTAAQTAASDQTVVDLGRRLYVQSCASCHGPDGQGGPYGPSLAGSGAAAWDFYLRTGRMPLAAPGEPVYRQPPAFDGSQIEALVAYGAMIAPGPAIPEVVTSADALGRGWHLYINNCAACHGTSGGGGSVGGGFIAPSLAESDPRTVVEALLIGPGPMPPFVLPEDDLAAVATYVQYLREAPTPGGLSLGGAGPVPEGFIAVVVGLLVLVLVARWVGRGREPDGVLPEAPGSAAEVAAAATPAPPRTPRRPRR